MQGNSALTTRHLASGLSELEIAAFGPLSCWLQTASGGVAVLLVLISARAGACLF